MPRAKAHPIPGGSDGHPVDVAVPLPSRGSSDHRAIGTAASQIDRRTASDPERGSAMVELAIVAPLFLVLILWAVSFGELSLLRIRQQEASRFLAWETTTHLGAKTAPAEARRAAEARTLARYADLEGHHLSTSGSGWILRPTAVHVDLHGVSMGSRARDELGREVVSGVERQLRSGDGFLPAFSTVLRGIEGGWMALLSRQGFDREVGVATTVRVQVENLLVPTWSSAFLPRLRTMELAPASSLLETETWALADGEDVGLGSDHPFRDRVRRIAHLGIGAELESKSKTLASALSWLLPALDAEVVSQRYVDPAFDTSRPGCEGNAWAATGKWRNGPKVGTQADGMSPAKCFDTLPMEASGLGGGYQADPTYRIFRARGKAAATGMTLAQDRSAAGSGARASR